jgi:aquaporin related protein
MSDAKVRRTDFVAFLGELVGTTMFLYFAFAGTQVANIGSQNNQSSTTGQTTGFNPGVLLYISLVFGFSLTVNVWIFFRISGGLFNPAVTLAMAMTNGISWLRATLLFVAQISGGMLASILVKVMFPTQFNVRTTLSAGTSLVRGVFIEGVLTFELVFTVTDLGYLDWSCR